MQSCFCESVTSQNGLSQNFIIPFLCIISEWLIQIEIDLILNSAATSKYQVDYWSKIDWNLIIR